VHFVFLGVTEILTSAVAILHVERPDPIAPTTRFLPETVTCVQIEFCQGGCGVNAHDTLDGPDWAFGVTIGTAGLLGQPPCFS